ERVWCAIEETYPLRVHRTDDVDGGLNGFHPILGMRLDVQIDAFLFEYGYQLFHRAPPGIFAGLDHRARVAAIAGTLVRVRTGAELGVHGVDFHIDGDLDSALPMADR